MKVNLNIMDRVTFGDILPERGDMLTLKVIKSIRDKVDLSIEENEEIELKLIQNTQGGSSFTWNLQKAKDKGDKAIEFSDVEMEVIIKHHKTLDEGKQILLRDLSLWEKLLSGGK